MLKISFLFFSFLATSVAGNGQQNDPPELVINPILTRKALAAELDGLMTQLYKGNDMDVYLKFSKLNELAIKGFGIFSRMMTINRPSPAALEAILNFKKFILDVLNNTQMKKIEKKLFYLFPKQKYDPLMGIVTFFKESLEEICEFELVNMKKKELVRNVVFCTDIYAYFKTLHLFLSNFETQRENILIEEDSELVTSLSVPSSPEKSNLSLSEKSGEEKPFVIIPESEAESEAENKNEEQESAEEREKKAARIYKAWVNSAPKIPRSQELGSSDVSDSSDESSKFWGKIYFSEVREPMKDLFEVLEDSSDLELPQDVVEGGAGLAKEVSDIIGRNEKVFIVRRDPGDMAQFSMIIRKEPMEALIKAFEAFINILNQHPGCRPCETRNRKAKAALDALQKDFLPNGAFFEEKVLPGRDDFLKGLASLPNGQVAEIANLPFQPEAPDRLAFFALLERVRLVIVGKDFDAIERVQKSQLYSPIRNFYFHLQNLIFTHGGDSSFIDWATKYDGLVQSLCKTSILNDRNTNNEIQYQSILWKEPENISKLLDATDKLMDVLPSVEFDISFSSLAAEARFIAQKLKGSNDKNDKSTFLIVEGGDRLEFGNIPEPPRPEDKVQNPTAKASPLLLPNINQLDSSIDQKKPEKSFSDSKSNGGSDNGSSSDSYYESSDESVDESGDKVSSRQNSIVASEPRGTYTGSGKNIHRPARLSFNPVKKLVAEGKGLKKDRNRNADDRTSEISLTGNEPSYREVELPPAGKQKALRRTVIVIETYACEYCLNQDNIEWMSFKSA